MRVLIVEDNAFNAFCLRRLLESVVTSVSVTIVNNSQAALSYLNCNLPDLVVVDGFLGVTDEQQCNGPELANVLFHQFPHLPIIAWTDSELMRDAFAVVFNQHNKILNECNFWNKVIGLERISRTWAYYFDEFIANQNTTFSYQSSNASYC